jgi:hypothetical protein
MKVALSVIILILSLSTAVYANDLTKNEAIKMAELFILQNGYTNAPAKEIKKELNIGTVEFANSREELLRRRFNTLKRKAIGVRKGRKSEEVAGWSVAFDYADTKLKNRCRVVTMDADGSNMGVEHVEGIRSYFVGFDIETNK